MTTLTGLFTLGRDAELRTTADSQQVASLALAYNYGRKGGDAEPRTQWVEAALWGDRAAKLAEHLTKGRQMYVQVDDLHVETFTKRDNTMGVKLVGRVGQLEFTRGAAIPPPPPPPPPPPAPKTTGSGFDDMDDDIPF